MANRAPHQLPATPPPTVLEEIRRHFSRREVQAMETLFAFRTTAQYVDNAITEWLVGTVGSPARFQILVFLWATRGRGVPHKEIVAALGVTRATVSGLMAALEREGLVKSSVGHDDRRNLLAALTPRGESVIGKTIEQNTNRLRTVFASFSSDDMAAFKAVLQRIRQGFAASASSAPAKPRPRRPGAAESSPHKSVQPADA